MKEASTRLSRGWSAAIARTSPVPLYYQVSEAIRRAIADGEYQRGQELPSEGELCRIYGVSRITVRQAVAELLNDGVLVRNRPRGPLVVTGPRIPRELLEHAGPFVSDFLEGGLRRRTEILTAERVAATPRVAAQLKVELGTPVYHIERLHLGDDEPLARQSSWLPESIVPGLLGLDLSGSLQELYESKYGLYCVKKIQRVGARSASNEEASLLALGRRAPVLELERIVLLSDGQPVEYVQYTLRADRFVIVSEVTRTPATLPEPRPGMGQW